MRQRGTVFGEVVDAYDGPCFRVTDRFGEHIDIPLAEVHDLTVVLPRAIGSVIEFNVGGGKWIPLMRYSATGWIGVCDAEPLWYYDANLNDSREWRLPS